MHFYYINFIMVTFYIEYLFIPFINLFKWSSMTKINWNRTTFITILFLGVDIDSQIITDAKSIVEIIWFGYKFFTYFPLLGVIFPLTFDPLTFLWVRNIFILANTWASLDYRVFRGSCPLKSNAIGIAWICSLKISVAWRIKIEILFIKTLRYFVKCFCLLPKNSWRTDVCESWKAPDMTCIYAYA